MEQLNLQNLPNGSEVTASFDFYDPWSVITFTSTPSVGIGWSQDASFPFDIVVSLDANGMSNLAFTNDFADPFESPNPDLTVRSDYAAFLGQSMNGLGANGFASISLTAGGGFAPGTYEIGTLEVLGSGGIQVSTGDEWELEIAVLTNTNAAGRTMIIDDGDVRIQTITTGQDWHFEMMSNGSLDVFDAASSITVSGSGTVNTSGAATANQGFDGGLIALFGGTVILDSTMTGYMAARTDGTLHVTETASLTQTLPGLAAIYGNIQNATTATSTFIIDGSVTGDMLLGGHSSVITSTNATGQLNGNAELRAGDDSFDGIVVLGTIDLGDGDDDYSGVALNTGQTVAGGAGNDTIVGTMADDMLFGGADNDVISGWFGTNDILTGGAGDDTFVFLQQGSGGTITDFGTGADVIEVSGLSADELLLRLFSTGKNGQQDLTELGGGSSRANGDRQTIDLRLEQDGADVTMTLLQGGYVVGTPGNPALTLTLSNTLISEVGLDDFIFT